MTCIEWSKGRDKHGRGVAWYNGKNMTAPRMVWTQCEGPIPAGMQVLHTCDNPGCVNPAHLWLGTRSDNMRDMTRKGRNFVPPHSNRTRDTKGRFINETT